MIIKGPFKPNIDISYDHYLCDSPLGEFKIEFKSWKEHPSYCIYLDDVYISSQYSVDDVKECIFIYLENKLIELQKCLGHERL